MRPLDPDGRWSVVELACQRCGKRLLATGPAHLFAIGATEVQQLERKGELICQTCRDMTHIKAN